jgi:hypothetical protein
MHVPEILTASQAKTLTDLLKRIFQEIVEPIHSDLTAHLIALEALRKMNPDAAQMIDAGVSVARESPALQESMHERYHVTLEKSLQRVLEHARDVESLESIFRDLKPTYLN